MSGMTDGISLREKRNISARQSIYTVIGGFSKHTG